MIYAKIDKIRFYKISFFGEFKEVRSFIKNAKNNIQSSEYRSSSPYFYKKGINFYMRGSSSDIVEQNDCHDAWKIEHLICILATFNFIPVSDTFFYKP